MTQEELIEKVAEGLWHRFAPAHHMEWEHETHKAEYRDAARAALSIALEEAAKELKLISVSVPKETLKLGGLGIFEATVEATRDTCIQRVRALITKPTIEGE